MFTNKDQVPLKLDWILINPHRLENGYTDTHHAIYGQMIPIGRSVGQDQGTVLLCCRRLVTGCNPNDLNIWTDWCRHRK